jgi:putative ABC transport system permease protein
MSAKGGRLGLKDGLRVASVGLRARPLRAALSALGIAIGTAAIVAVLGLSSSSQAGLIAEIDRLGTNLLTAEAGQSLTGGRRCCLSKRRRGSHTWTTSNWWHTPP